MLSHKDYADYVLKSLDSIPIKSDDKNKELVYRYGLLVGIVAKLMCEDSMVSNAFKDTIKKIK
jgi:hypothetical protein